MQVAKTRPSSQASVGRPRSSSRRPASAKDKRPESANARMQMLSGAEAVWRAPTGAEPSKKGSRPPLASVARVGSAGRPRSARQSPREDSHSLQVKRRQEPPVAAMDTAAGPLPYIRVERPASARGRTTGAPSKSVEDTDSFLASLDNSLAASREVFAAVPTNAQLSARRDANIVNAGAKGGEPPATAPAAAPVPTAPVVQEFDPRALFGLASSKPQPAAQPPTPSAPADAGPDTDAFLASLDSSLASSRQMMKGVVPPAAGPTFFTEPEPEPEPMPNLSLEGDGMEALDRRLEALQQKQEKRRGELDEYMIALQHRETASENGTPEALVEFPDGFMEMVESMKREELERPWLSYLEGGERPGGGDPEETEEQARNRKGLDLIARLDGILAEKTKEAKRAAAFRLFERRLEAEARGEEVPQERRPGSVARQVEASMAVRKPRFVTLSDEREARVAALLEAEGEGSYDADCGYDRERLEEIDGQLQQFHPDTAEWQELVGIEGPGAQAEAQAPSDGPTDPDSVAGGGSDLGTAATESTVRLTAEQEDALKVQAAAREGSTAFVREAAVERVQKARNTAIDKQLRDMRTRPSDVPVPWAEDPSKLDEALAEAQREIGEVMALTDEQVKELCKISQVGC